MKFANELYLKYRLLLWPVISGLASIAILVLVIIPQILGYLSVRTEIQNTQERSGKLEAKAQSLENIDDVETQKNLQAVFSVLPTDREVPQAISTLQSLISRAGLSLKSTSYNASLKGTSKESFQLSVTVVGQIGALRNFLISLENTNRIFQVEAINVQFQSSGLAIEADIPVTVFYGKDKNKLVSLESEVPRLNEKEGELLSRLSTLVASNPSGSAGPESSSSSVPVGKSNPFE